MSGAEIGAIIVAFIAAAGAWASQRAASKASTVNTLVNTRMDAEKEAYERARQFDIETIQRQHAEIVELREQLAKTRERLAVLESKTPLSLQNWEGLLNDRLKQSSESDEPDATDPK